MDATQANVQNNVTAKMNEADVYQSMGLIDEAITIYNQLLLDNPSLDENELNEIKARLNKLEKTNEALNADATQISSEDISYIKENLAIDEDASSVIDSAFAFKELGLFAEASAEYEKLFKLGYPASDIIPELVLCYLETRSPNKVIYEINRIVSKGITDSQQKGTVKYLSGIEFEKRGHSELALKLYTEALELDPENGEIKEKLNFMKAGLSTGSKYEYLLNQKIMDTEQLKNALTMSKKMGRSVEFILISSLGIDKEDVGKSLSLYYGCPFKKYSEEIPAPVELIAKLKETFLLNEHWVPLAWDQDGVSVLVDDPRDLSKTDNIKALMKTKKLALSVGIKEDIEAYIKRFFSKSNFDVEEESISSAVDVDELIPDISFEEEDVHEDEAADYDEASGKVVKLLDHIIVAAYRKNASDIHIEPSPQTKTLNIRFRIDGLCQEYMQVPNSMAKAIISRVKIMSSLDIAERRLPQDGKIKFKRKGIPPFELRIATLPSAGGFEDAVMRILAKAGAMKLEDMNLSERNFAVLKKILSLPYGLILAVGPTGSGKTTSLHAALGHINRPETKIWTAEDPVEITQLGLRQIEAKPRIGLNFARIMRSFLRADPDVIMIGEMRDEETASIGIEASLTGHLVFSTLHTNSAPETVTRLLDMGLNALNFSDAFLGVLAQRLVRRLCPKCKEEYHPTEEEFEDIVNYYGKRDFGKTGVEYTSDLTLYRPKGCDSCTKGYKGRLAIHELMDGTREIKGMIKKAESTENLFIQAIEDGMLTLKQDGLMKVFQGLTYVDEVRRVCIS